MIRLWYSKTKMFSIKFSANKRSVFYLPNNLDLLISLISLEDVGEL